MKAGVFILSFVAALLMHAQAPQRFYTRFGGDGDDIAYSGKQTNDKQYIIAGSSSSYGVAGNTDVYLVKVDSMGFPIWQKFFGGSQNDIGRSVIQLADSGFVVTGYTNSFGAGGYDVFVIRTDKNGNTKWQKTFGGSDWDFAYDVVLASDGNLFVVGNTSSFGNGKMDAYILKIDLNGNLLLQKTYGGSENEELRSIIKTTDNYLASVGYTESRGEINGDGYFIKLNLNADTLLTKTFGGAYKDFASDIVQKNTTDYIIAGSKTFSLNTKSRSYMISYNATDSFSWDNNYYASKEDEKYESLASSSLTDNFTAYLRNVPVPSLKMQGNIWLAVPGGWNYLVNSFGGTEDDLFYSVEGTKDGGFLSVGETRSFGSVNRDIILVKQDSTIINYSSVVGITNESSTKSWGISNLGNKKIIFDFKLQEEPKSVSIYDLNGRLIEEFLIEDPTITKNFDFLPSSIYLMRVSFKNGITQFTKFSLY